MMTDRSKSLQEIEGDDWGEPTANTHLVTTCHRLRRKSIEDFGVEDVRIMIGQQIGLESLVPLAIEFLEKDPFAEGDFYPGDLLKSLLSGPRPEFWQDHQDMARRVERVLGRAIECLPTMQDIERSTLEDSLKEVSWQIEELKKAANQPPNGTAHQLAVR